MKVFLVFIVIWFFLIFAKNISFAVTLDISNAPSSILKEEAVDIAVVVTGAKASSLNYLRGAFYENGTTSYLGYTFNHENNWYNSVSPIDPKKFLQIQIDTDGNWNGILKVKPDTKSTHFKGNGNYLFKVGRYTESGTSVSDWSESKEITLLGNDPTPTLTPTPTKIPSTPTLTHLPTLGQAKLTSTSAPAKGSATPTKTPTSSLVQIKNSPTLSPTNNFKKANTTVSLNKKDSSSASSVNFSNKSVLGSKNEKIISPPPEVKNKTSEQINPTVYKSLIIGGVLFLCSACGILVFRKYRLEKELDI